jgi:hypothetical protein
MLLSVMFVVQAAAAAGQLAVLQWAHSQLPPLKIDAWACRAAAANGHVHVLQWLREHSVPWDAWTTRAGVCSVPMLKQSRLSKCTAITSYT